MSDEDFWPLLGLAKPTDEDMERFLASQKPPKPYPHAADDGGCGCHQCWGSPPPETKLQQRVLPILLREMFAPGYQSPSEALHLLQQLVADEKTAQQAKAKPGLLRKAERATREELENWRRNYIVVNKRERGWVKAAANFFGIDTKTVYSRINDK